MVPLPTLIHDAVELLKASLNVVVGKERALYDPEDLTLETTAQIGLYAHRVRMSRRHARSSVRSAGREGSPMRRPLVTIRDVYRYPQRGATMVAREKSIWFGCMLAASLVVLVLAGCGDVSESGSSQMAQPSKKSPPTETAESHAAGRFADCNPTQPDMLGPFYKAGAPVRTSVGSGYVLSETVLAAEECKPIPDAHIEFWLANPEGEYDDAHRATVFAGKRGGYRFSKPPQTSLGEERGLDDPAGLSGRTSSLNGLYSHPYQDSRTSDIGPPPPPHSRYPDVMTLMRLSAS
jgi:hypothetical protein